MNSTTAPASPAVRIIGIVLTVLLGVPFLLFSWMALSSRFGWSDSDPHGYALIFGSLFAIALAIPLTVTVPLILPRGRRATAGIVSAAAFLVIAVGLFAALLTA
ncbi:hypothetical protein M2317_002133 [Microbacterium sp. ZKA21]|uniref:hypothetical protein n=1 Tax=Microbacterium sp. ZKA21 TaxID=3381694 RepID=UPI003D211673